MASGIAVNDSCIKEYSALSRSRTHRAVILKINDDMSEVIVDGILPKSKGDHEGDWKDFVKMLPEADCRYAVVDFEWKDQVCLSGRFHLVIGVARYRGLCSGLMLCPPLCVISMCWCGRWGLIGAPRAVRSGCRPSGWRTRSRVSAGCADGGCLLLLRSWRQPVNSVSSLHVAFLFMPLGWKRFATCVPHMRGIGCCAVGVLERAVSVRHSPKPTRQRADPCARVRFCPLYFLSPTVSDIVYVVPVPLVYVLVILVSSLDSRR